MKSAILLITTLLFSVSILAKDVPAAGGSRGPSEPMGDPRGKSVDVAQYNSASHVPDILAGLKRAAAERDQQYKEHDEQTRTIDGRTKSIKSATRKSSSSSQKSNGADDNKGGSDY